MKKGLQKVLARIKQELKTSVAMSTYEETPKKGLLEKVRNIIRTKPAKK